MSIDSSIEGRLDRDDGAAQALAADIVGMAGRLAAASCRWLLLVARFDAAEAFARMGFASTATWLAWACGLSKRTAVDHVHVARALATFPAIAQAMGAGRLSYSHARAIGRLVRPDEHELVESLVSIAQHGTVAHLEVLVRGLRTVDDNERRAQGWLPDEFVRHSWTDESSWRLSSRLDPERGALVWKAIEKTAAAAGVTQVDALVRIAEMALVSLADADADAESRTRAKAAAHTDSGRRPPPPVRELRDDERAAVVIHIDAAAVARAHSAADGSPGSSSIDSARPYARLANGPGLPDRVVRRLTCAGRSRTVVRGVAGSVLDLGRNHRLVSDKLMRALLIRDQSLCRYPGCANARWLQAHHVVHWLDGGPTDMANLILLCSNHHHAHHEGEFSIAAQPGERFRFARADGQQLTEYVDPTRLMITNAPIDEEHRHVLPEAPTPNWDGQKLDRQYAVAVLAHERRWLSQRRSVNEHAEQEKRSA